MGKALLPNRKNPQKFVNGRVLRGRNVICLKNMTLSSRKCSVLIKFPQNIKQLNSSCEQLKQIAPTNSWIFGKITKSGIFRMTLQRVSRWERRSLFDLRIKCGRKNSPEPHPSDFDPGFRENLRFFKSEEVLCRERGRPSNQDHHLIVLRLTGF